MRKSIALLAASTIALAPAAALAQTAPGQGQFNGSGWIHMNGPGQGSTGQPLASCEDALTYPGNSHTAPGNGSPFIGETSTAGSNYAGTQLQNMRNNQSTSQYDIACQNQLDNHGG